MKEFIEKYKIIVFLVAMIIVLAFVKNYFGKKINDSNNSAITPTPTIMENSDGSTTVKSSDSNLVDTKNLNEKESISEKNNKETMLSDGSIVHNSETDKRYNQLVEKGRTYENERDYQNWFDTLSFADQELLSGNQPIQISQLSDELPYEGKTFIVKSIISNSVIQVKSKIDDLEKAEIDVRDWLSSKSMDFDNLVISWE